MPSPLSHHDGLTPFPRNFSQVQIRSLPPSIPLALRCLPGWGLGIPVLIHERLIHGAIHTRDAIRFPAMPTFWEGWLSVFEDGGRVVGDQTRRRKRAVATRGKCRRLRPEGRDLEPPHAWNADPPTPDPTPDPRPPTPTPDPDPRPRPLPSGPYGSLGHLFCPVVASDLAPC